jgi:hypothetical protein
VGVQIPPSAPSIYFAQKRKAGFAGLVCEDEYSLLPRYYGSYHRLFFPNHRGVAAERQER